MAPAVIHRPLAFDSSSVVVGFVVDRMTLSQYFQQVLRFFSVSVIPPVFDPVIHSFTRSGSNPGGVQTGPGDHSLLTLGTGYLTRG
jgi:hypothetical protein